MATPKPSELQFLKENKIDIALLYDATGQSTTAWRSAMEKIGKKFAFGTSPCGAGNHSLRNRHGHCVQCEPSRISYALRHSKPGQVYILGSRSQKLIKIGVTTDLESRLSNLKSMQYGGSVDWCALVITETVSGAGKVESAIHRQLEKHRADGQSHRAGETRATYELYSCDFPIAKFALERSAPKGTRIHTKASPLVLNAFSAMNKAA